MAEADSLEDDDGIGTISLDVPSLPPGRDYQLRYIFGQKEILRNAQSLSMQEDTISTGDAIVECNQPFFTQELVLVDRKVLQQRVKNYMR